MQAAHRRNHKITSLCWLTCLLTLVFIGRLFHLQIYLNRNLFFRSEKNFLRTEKIASPRGDIVDACGNLLATNRPVINVYWHGTGNIRFSKEQQKVLSWLPSILEESLEHDTLAQHERQKKELLIGTDISFEQLGQIKELFPDNENLIITTDFKRLYPHNTLACHVLGYLGCIDAEPVGRMGVEKLREESLKGEHGSLLKTINSVGSSVATTEIKKALAGNTITTTLELPLQRIIESVFPTTDYAGTFILMNARTGALKAIASYPHFDPNMFLQPIQQKTWDELIVHKPFLNRAFDACYPPASIFKLVTTSAALEQELISPETTWECKGFAHYKGRKYWCNRHYGHGQLNTMQSLAQSCNIMLFEIGKQMDIDVLADYAHRFGLGNKTGVVFHEQTGIVPDREWKMLHKGERWWQGETLSASIGQSYLLATPVQIARMISSIFEGYLVKPRIFVDEPIATEPLAISSETLDFLRQSMKRVVTTGTGRRINKIKDIEVYAKTGTAQTSDLRKKNLGKEYQEHAWFVAYFTYKQQEPLTIVILVEHAKTSRVATNIAKQFLIAYKKLIDQQHTT